MDVTLRSTPELDVLAGLFYDSVDGMGVFEEVGHEQLPPACRSLLANDRHMTANLEGHHGCPVDVVVLEEHRSGTHYWRKILLKRQEDGAVVQFGIVRLARALLAEEIRQEIEEGGTPLGRVLIQADVLRNVRLLSLWRITPTKELCDLFGLSSPQPCFGRTALIYCDNALAIELLEVVMRS